MTDGEGAGGPRLFFTTQEACRKAGVSPNTLRYWERRLGLTFMRSPRGKRMFRPEDIERLRRVAELLHDGYSLKAVPRRMRENVQMELPLAAPAPRRADRVMLKRIKNELEEMLDSIDGGKK